VQIFNFSRRGLVAENGFAEQEMPILNNMYDVYIIMQVGDLIRRLINIEILYVNCMQMHGVDKLDCY